MGGGVTAEERPLFDAGGGKGSLGSGEKLFVMYCCASGRGLKVQS